MKKAYIIATIIFVIILGVIGYYYLSAKNSSNINTTPTESGPNFFPFGGNTGSNQGQNNLNQNNGASNETTELKTGNLWQVTANPVAGYYLYATSTGYATISSSTEPAKENVIRFIERATGYIFDEKTTTREPQRLTQNTVPKVIEALFINNGTELVFHTENTSGQKESYFATLRSSTTSNETETISLNGSLYKSAADEIVYIQTLNKVLLTEKTSSGSVFYLANNDGSGKVEIYRSPLKNWQLKLAGGTLVVATSKPSALTNGVSLLINTQNKSVSFVAENITGLTANVSPDGNYALLGKSTNGGVELIYKNLKNGDEKTLKALGTIPEKCIWADKDFPEILCAVPFEAPLLGYPDSWYKGLVSFNDVLWKIDLITGISKIILDPSEANRGNMDMINLSFTPDGKSIVFQNKKDLTLWVFETK